jgi:MoaA/NifB/PqqE/SkfB family radical SAM enzyme
MLTEEVHAAGVAGRKITEHEEAAHEKRNWVRLTFDCNNRCVFCLDSDTHDGKMRDREEIKKQILDGRRHGATRLILSGGEPTIHPNYIDFIRLGARAGYRKIQTVTNGRLFSYPQFLDGCVSAGLSEITFSLHGPNARIHDALVGVKGAFDEEIAGLKNALADGRLVVNVDIVINRANVTHLAEMLEQFIALGVREFDLLQVVPFGRAFTDGKDILFYDLEEMRPHLLRALEFSRRPDVHLWLNRFPPQHLEGFEHLIQDPYKLNDEVRGRKEEFARLLDEGQQLDCRDPARCRYCYLEKLCDTLEETRAQSDFSIVRVDSGWEAKQDPVFGGDPASAKRAFHLPLVQSAPVDLRKMAAGATTLWVRAPSLEEARRVIADWPAPTHLELELDEYRGLDLHLDAGKTDLDADKIDLVDGKILTRAVAANLRQAEALLSLPGNFEVVLLLTRETAAWAADNARDARRLVLRQPTHERLTDSALYDLADFSRLPSNIPVENLPACVLGRAPRPRPPVLDTAMRGADGRLEIFRYTRRYLLDRYYTKSLRCRSCVHHLSCDGMHVNYVRAHGYAAMQPIQADVASASG